MKAIYVNSEKPVYFQSRGKNLFGILHHAVNNNQKVGIIFLNPGLQNRVGPHRIYVKIARRLNQIGFSILRMDFPGVGDSEGDIKDIHFDLFDTEDTLSAIDFFIQEEKIDNVVLLGICAGARNALKVAAKDNRIDSIVLLSLPVITDNKPKTRESSEPVSEVAAKRFLKTWIKKAFSVKAWKRFFTSDRVSPSIWSVVRGLIVGRKKWKDNRHKEFFKAFEAFLSSKRKALFIYGERDIILKEEFEVKFNELSEGKRHNCEYYVVPNGNHTFSSIEAEKNAIDKTVEWIAQQY